MLRVRLAGSLALESGGREIPLPSSRRARALLAYLAAPVYERLLPYADVALTAGRAISSFGSTERLLGGLAAVLGRHDEAAARLQTAVRANDDAGMPVWADHARRALDALPEGRTFPAQGR